MEVLRAYRGRCAVHRLRHDELLDAAHILPDGHPKKELIGPVLSDGRETLRAGKLTPCRGA